jgi:putative ABC transport system permease protein
MDRVLVDRHPRAEHRLMLGRVGRQLHSLLFKATAREEVDAELEFHVAMRARELMAEGLNETEARRQARARLGDPDRLTARLAAIGESRDRRARWRERLDEVRQDLHFAWRQLARGPAFAAVAIGTLAIGIGGTTAIFSAVHAVVLRSFPWAHPERTVHVSERWKNQDGYVSVGNFLDWQGLTSSFQAWGAERFDGFTLDAGPAPEQVTGGRVTQPFFTVFGQRPLLGRTFRQDEDTPGNDHVVVLSEGLWRERYAADSAILGHAITINLTKYIVVGVMPAAFDPTLSAERLWVPAAFMPEQRADHDNHSWFVVGLLRPGASIETARRDVARAAAELAARYPREDLDRSATVYPLGPYLIGNAGDQLLIVLGAVALVFLIACVNVANLLLARASVRARELAVRAAIGAGRARLVRHLLTEGALLSLIASAVGVAIAAGLIRVLVAAAPAGAIPRLADTHIDLGVLGFALGLAAVATVASALVPAIRLARQDPQEALRGEGRGIGAGRSRERLRGALVAVEVTMALVLLVGSGLLVRSALVLQHTPLGFDISDISSAAVALPAPAYHDPETIRRTFARIATALSGASTVQDAALVSARPLSGPGSDNGLIPEGRPPRVEYAIQASIRLITPDYFAVMRIPLRRGRVFTAADAHGATRVMIVSERFANLAWPAGDPIGKRVLCCEGSEQDPKWKTIVGVVGDVRSRGPTGNIDPEFYLPLDQTPDAAWGWINQSMTMAARSRSSTDAISAMRAAVRSVDPALPLSTIQTARDAFRETLAPARFNALLLGALALIGLMLSAAGIFSVIAYFVNLRTHEIGVRRAMGATAADVLWLMIRQGLQPVLFGFAIGAATSLLAARLLRSALYGVAPRDPITFAAVALVLAVVALAAIVIPARRAMGIEPTTALTR